MTGIQEEEVGFVVICQIVTFYLTFNCFISTPISWRKHNVQKSQHRRVSSPKMLLFAERINTKHPRSLWTDRTRKDTPSIRGPYWRWTTAQSRSEGNTYVLFVHIAVQTFMSNLQIWQIFKLSRNECNHGNKQHKNKPFCACIIQHKHDIEM